MLALKSGLALSAMAAALGCVPASAQEAAPQAAPAKTFQGTHVEALLGYDNVSSGIDGTNRSVDGLQYGGGIGHDFQFNRVVVGFGSEYAGTTAELRDRSTTRENYLRPGGDFYVGARLGYVVAPATMVYLKGGYTSTELRFQSDDLVNPIYEERPKASGYRIGIGVEQNLGRHAFVRAEYRYSNYDNLRITDPNNVATDFDINIDRSQAVVGVGFRF